MSGHSKWANIKRKKAVVDAKRGKVFTQISKELTIAARQGGGDPTGNPRLRLAMQNARAVNMPSDNIKRAIQKGTGELEGVTYEEITFEGYAPFGVAVIIETVTDNRNRTVAEMRSLFSKYGGSMGESNSVAWNFNRKGVVALTNNGADEEKMLEHVLETGAEDMAINDDLVLIYCPTDMLAQCQRYFEENKFDVKESKFEYIPNTTVKIETAAEAQKLMKFMDAIEDQDDVQNVFSNVEMDEAIMESLENS